MIVYTKFGKFIYIANLDKVKCQIGLDNDYFSMK